MGCDLSIGHFYTGECSFSNFLRQVCKVSPYTEDRDNKLTRRIDMDHLVSFWAREQEHKVRIDALGPNVIAHE